MNDNLYFDPSIVSENIVGGAKDKAKLLGLLSSSVANEVYVKEVYGTYSLEVIRRILPNGHSRLDILYINEFVVGTILSSRLMTGLYHMVGMFVGEKYRSKTIGKTFSEFMSDDGNKDKRLTPAAFLLNAYVNDVVRLGQNEVCLEVMNGNIAAWMLYEKCCYGASESKRPSVELLDEELICVYAKLRMKKISKWYPVKNSKDMSGLAVQWQHIPDCGVTTHLWSANRIYLIRPSEQHCLLRNKNINPYISIFNTVYSIFLYGEILNYLNDKLKLWHYRS
jgi:hypothetical protein